MSYDPTNDTIVRDYNVRRYLGAFDPREHGGHDVRFALSLEWLEPLLRPGTVLYDFGQGLENGPMAVVARRLFPGIDWRTTGAADLRYPLTEIADGAADVVTATEILEHMRDRDESPLGSFTFSGIRNLLSEAFRILKPGGSFFVSTPNASRYSCAWQLVRGETPSWVIEHVHEFGFCELRAFITGAGFAVTRMESFETWQRLDCPDELRRLMDRLAPDVPRGHCTFVLARRP